MRSFNRRVLNRVLGPLATRLPWFGVLVHTGRKTRRAYRTPINVFRTRDGYVIALTYGADTDWLKNAQATGECLLETRDGTVRLTAPRVFRDSRRAAMPRPVRAILSLVGVADFVEFMADR
jgi:deazaflavin-dependent oxidoreductase (nitroreductase family)